MPEVPESQDSKQEFQNQTVHGQIWAQPIKSPRPWESDLDYMCLSFLICKTRKILAATSQNGYKVYINFYMEYAQNCAWHIISAN